MKYFMDTHDKTKGSFPTQELTEEQFFEQFAALEEAAKGLGVFGHAAHVNLKAGKAFCFMSGPDEEAIRKAHAAINLPDDSITEVRRVTGADMRSQPRCKSARRANASLLS
jgi:Nickel responsive protein SCO4226-like